MENNYSNLNRLFDRLRSIGFWSRLFNWRSIRNLVMDAAADLQRLQMNNQSLSDTVISKQNRVNEMAAELRSASEKNERLATQITRYESREESRQKEHASQAATLKEIQDGILASRKQEINERHQAELERIENLKLTWSNHEEEVRQAVRTICSRHTISYIDKVPFKGEPDNTICIAGEYIIFDAKSPRGEELTNFPNYIKDQSEKAKKYAKEENVKKWIFFVIPSNTLAALKSFVYPMADFDVFVITLDALEPIILSLKKIEDYDFAEQMDPGDRENICRVLGKFAHLSKRRIQIDTYFINQFMELAYKTESDLPPDVLEKVMEFERAEKLNPPVEKRAKAISLTELEKSTGKLRNDAVAKGILVEDARISVGLNNLPLYKAE